MNYYRGLDENWNCEVGKRDELELNKVRSRLIKDIDALLLTQSLQFRGIYETLVLTKVVKT